MPGGRKSKWDELDMDDKLILIEGWCRDGATDKDIYERLGVSSATFYQWKLEKTELVETLKKGKEIVDRKVENALLKRALGYEYEETVKELGIDKETGKQELIVTKVTKKEIVPDTTAQIFWLKNRKPKAWRDKQEVVNIDGAKELINEDVLDKEFDEFEELKTSTEKFEDK